LVIYSAQGYDKAEVTAFEQATGIKVNLDDNSTGPLLDKIQAEKNNPQWGLLWVDGDEAFAQMDLQGMLLKGFEPNVSWDTIGSQLIPKDQSYIPTGVTMAGTVIYDSTVVHNPPTTWNDLLQSKWQYVVGMNDPSISGPTYPFVAGIMNYLGGVSQGEQYFTNLQSNGLDVHETNGDTLQALEVGHIKIGIIQSSAAIGATIKHPNLKVVFPDPVTAIPSVIGIDRHAPAAEIAEAKKFAEFVLSSAGQKVMQTGDPHGDSLYWPVLNGIQPLPALPPYSSIPHVQVINPYKWGPLEAQVNSWFDNNIA
jgi:iron(III) transport system substrate-binding protein